MEHLAVLCGPDGTQQDSFLDAHRFVHLEKPDALRWRADTESRALFTHFVGRRLARMRSAGKTLVARIVAAIIRRHGARIIVAPHQAGTLALLFEVPAHQFGAALGDDLWILMAIAGGHQGGALRWSSAWGRLQRFLIQRHELPHAIRAAFAAEQSTHTEVSGQARRLIAAARRPQRRIRALHRLWQNLARGNLKVLALIRHSLLRPDARQHVGKLKPHASRIAQVRSIRDKLVGIASAAKAHVHSPTT